MEAQSHDRLALSLIRAMEPALRKHLGEAATDRELIGEFYLGLRRSLAVTGQHAGRKRARKPALAHELALTVYMIAAARVSGSEVGPDLLEALRRAIAGAMQGEPARDQHVEGGQNP